MKQIKYVADETHKISPCIESVLLSLEPATCLQVLITLQHNFVWNLVLGIFLDTDVKTNLGLPVFFFYIQYLIHFPALLQLVALLNFYLSKFL